MVIVIINTNSGEHIADVTGKTCKEAKDAMQFFATSEAGDAIEYNPALSAINNDLIIIRLFECRGCETLEDVQERQDAYGIFTGRYCDTCYDTPGKYPYHKHRYDYEGYGERLEDDY